MEERGTKAKIQRRLSESTDPKLGKLVCHICSDKGKMQSCTHCNKGACGIHSMALAVQNPARICDVCFREKTIQSFSAKSSKRDELAHEISVYAEQRDTNTQVLNKSSGRIRNLNKEIQEKPDFYKEKIQQIEWKIDECRAKVEIKTSELPEMQKETLRLEMETEMTKNRQKDIDEELRRMKAEVEILIKERTALVGDLNEVSEFIRGYVPVKILRRLICNPCYQQVRHAFVQMFKPVVPIKDEVNAGKVKNVPNRKGVCTNCELW